MITESEIVSSAERHYGVSFRHVGRGEYRSLGGCPKCGDGGKGTGSDRFRLFVDDHALVWCRRCGFTEFIDNIDGSRPTPEDIAERRMRSLERARQDHERRLSVLEQMHKSTDHLRYFHNLAAHTEAIEYWCGEGMSLQTIDDYMLGYCPRCPTDREGRASYTIPVMIRGKLFNIRHRLIGADNGDKYRPQMAGLPSVLFNADFLYQDSCRILITEGEKKSIIAAQTGFENVGLMGKSGFNPAWAVRFERFPRVFVALDPDATEQAAEIAELFGDRGRVVILPDKLDDMIVRYGATKDDIESFLALGKRV